MLCASSTCVADNLNVSFKGKIKLNKLTEKCLQLLGTKDFSSSIFNQDYNSNEMQELRQKYEKGIIGRS